MAMYVHIYLYLDDDDKYIYIQTYIGTVYEFVTRTIFTSGKKV